MSDHNSSSMPDKVRRRKRIERFKLAIWLVLVLWVLISITVLVVMAIGIHSLNNKIKVLEENQITLQDYINENFTKPTEETGEGTDTGDLNSEEITEAEVSDDEEAEISGYVYLTFDDGPSENTTQILDILDEYNVKATFFVCGKDDEDSIALYKEIVDRGNTLGMHSYSHNYSTLYSSLKAFKSDYEKLHSLLEEATGLDIKLYRFPGGSSNQVSNIDMEDCIKWFNKIGVTYYDWNVSSEDAVSNDYTASSVIENVMKDVSMHTESVVLMHDTVAKGETVKALPKLIKKLQTQGYEILPITDDTTPVQHITAESVS